jgi:AcrR family transcriptional regulator
MSASRPRASAGKGPRRVPKQERSEETIRVLLTATELVLGEVGVERATVASIAERAGVGVATLFHYFPSRAALLAAWEESVLFRMGGILAKELATLLETKPPLDYSIRRIVHVGCALHLEHMRLYGGRTRSSAAPPLKLARLNVRLAIVARSAEVAAGVLANAVDAHLLKPKDLPFALQIASSAAVVMNYMGATLHPEHVASGAFQEEVASLACRYLLGDAADATPRTTLDPTANLPTLRASGRRQTRSPRDSSAPRPAK